MSFMRPAGVERETVSRQWMTADRLADENGLNAAENCFTLASHEMFASLRKRIQNGKGRRLNRQLYLSRIVHAKYRQQTWTLLLKWFPCANNHNLKYKNEVVTLSNWLTCHTSLSSVVCYLFFQRKMAMPESSEIAW